MAKSETIRSEEEAKQLLKAFQSGELMLNLNVPSEWNGRFQPRY